MLSVPRNAEYPIIALFVVPDAFPGLAFPLTLISIPTRLIEESLRCQVAHDVVRASSKAHASRVLAASMLSSSVRPSPRRPPISPRSDFRPTLRNRRVLWQLVSLLTLPLIASQIAQPKSLTKALPRILTIHRWHPKNNMPHVLNHSATNLVIKSRLQDPRPNLLILLLRPLPDALT